MLWSAKYSLVLSLTVVSAAHNVLDRQIFEILIIYQSKKISLEFETAVEITVLLSGFKIRWNDYLYLCSILGFRALLHARATVEKSQISDKLIQTRTAFNENFLFATNASIIERKRKKGAVRFSVPPPSISKLIILNNQFGSK